MPRQIILMNKARIQRALRRMAIQAEESFPAPEALVIAGLNERGYILAQHIKKFLTEENKAAREIELLRFGTGETDTYPAMTACASKNVLIIDDVIFSGRTMFKALSAACSAGAPALVKLMALVDRGHRHYPLEAAITGIKVPTKLGEHIEVMFDSGIPDQVVLFKNQ